MSFSFTARVNNIKNPSGSLRAFATLIINDTIQVNGFRVIEGRNGLFVAPPQTKATKPNEDGKFTYYDDVRFMEETDEENRRGPVATAAFDAILKTYNEDNTTSGANDRPSPTGARPSSPMNGPARW